jgi:hypothetical protein
VGIFMSGRTRLKLRPSGVAPAGPMSAPAARFVALGERSGRRAWHTAPAACQAIDL